MTPHLTHDVVICTRNRPDDLQLCLASLAHQDQPPTTVRIIDASDPSEAAEVASVVASAASGADALPVVLRTAAPSTTAQRNLGVAESSADVIHFLDDDTVVEPTYLAAIVAAFEADHRPLADPEVILGVGGQPTNLPPPRPRRPWSRLISGDARPGSVLPSGRGILASGLSSPTDVDWLSGCAMSFRRAVLEVERFDEGLEGYALGEDLDLSYRVRQHGRLVVEPAARLEHRESPRNRWGRRRWATADVVNRRRRVASGTGRYSPRAFWTDGLAQLALWSLRGLRPGASDARDMARGLAAGLWAARRCPAAAPSPGPWPPSAGAVDEAPAG